MKIKSRKSTAVLLVCALLFSIFSFCCFASDGVISYTVTDYGYAKAVSCDPSASGNVVVPSKVKVDGVEYEVKIIGPSAFANCKNIKSITISEGITQIENKAFENCTSLETIDIPKSLMSCQYDAFDGCSTVTVNCYTSNYQFFAVYGFSDNIKVNILDSDFSEQTTQNFNSIVDIIRKVIYYILELLGFKNPGKK